MSQADTGSFAAVCASLRTDTPTIRQRPLRSVRVCGRSPILAARLKRSQRQLILRPLTICLRTKNGVAPVSTVAKRKDSVRSSLQSYDFEQSAGYWLILTARAYQKAFDEELAPYHLTYRQAQVLGWLVLDGDLTQVELADRMMIEPATLVGVLDRMERDGLIRRTAVQSDRRKKKIEISQSAGEVWGNVIACAKRIRSCAVEGLSDRQVKEFFKTLQTIMRNLENSSRKAESK